MPSACAPTSGRLASNVLMAACTFVLRPSRARADAVLLELLALAQPGRAGRHDEAGVPPGAQLGVDGCDDDVHVSDPAVGDPRLRAVQHPLVLGLVVDGAGAQVRDVAARVGLAHREGAELDLLGGPEALRD